VTPAQHWCCHQDSVISHSPSSFHNWALNQLRLS